MILFNKSTLFKSIICFLVLFCIILNFSTSIHANMLAGQLGLKALSMLAASMGIVGFIHNTGGFNPFYREFVLWVETAKNIATFSSSLVSAAIQSISTNSRMKVNEFSGLLQEFYTTEYAPRYEVSDVTTPIPELPSLEGATFRYANSVNFKPSEIEEYPIDPLPLDPTQIDKYYPRDSGYEIPLAEDYVLHIKYVTNTQTVGPASNYLTLYVEYMGELIEGFQSGGNNFNYIMVSKPTGLSDNNWKRYSGINPTKRISWAKPFYSGTDNLYRFDVQLEYNESGGNLLSFRILDTKENIVKSMTIENAIAPLVGTIDPNIDTDIPTSPAIPVPRDVPDSIPFPWQIGLDDVNNNEGISGYVGHTVEDIIDDSNSVSADIFINGIIGYNPEQINTLSQPTVITDSATGVITNVDVSELPNVNDDTDVGFIGGILSFLKNIFTIPEDISLDFSPLQDLSISKKFPFSLPWDFKNIFTVLISPPAPPNFNIEILNEEFNLDFSQFNALAKISRSFFSLIFVSYLIILTRRFIGGA